MFRFVNFLPFRLSERFTKLYFQALIRHQKEVHSLSIIHQFKFMDIQILPALRDNYMYLIVDKSTKQAAIVDPVEHRTVLKAVRDACVKLTTVLTTNHHWDHAGGNANLVTHLPGLTVYGGDERIAALTNVIGHNNDFKIGSLKVTCLFTPCQTSGHVCYFVLPPGDGRDSAVFTGDTLFLGGCGRFSEGTSEQMYKGLIKILSALPDSTLVFCGHEYTLRNLKYAAYVEPDNQNIAKMIAWSTERRQHDLPTVPSTIAAEKKYNPFMRVVEPSIMKYAGKKDPIEVMEYLRLEKNTFPC